MGPGREIGMNRHERAQEGPGGFIHIPLNYFVDGNGREHIFRFGGHRDLEKVLEMYRRFEPKQSCMGLPPEDPIRLEVWVRHFFEEGIGNLVVMDPDDSIVGHASILPISDGLSEYFMAVLQGDQSAGVGGMLARVVLEAARYLKVRRLWICVEKTNIRALRVHRRLGFQLREEGWGDDYEMTYVVDPNAEPEGHEGDAQATPGKIT
jgi:GNAT superfamily N-acetyltransferase